MSRKFVYRIIKEREKLVDRASEADPIHRREELISTISKLKDTMYANPKIVALAAPQIGIDLRAFCIRFANGDIRGFINPMYKSQKGIHFSRESNPSVEGEYIVERFDEVEAAYLTPKCQSELNLFQGAVAEVFQQMTDLIDGILISDEHYGLPVVKGWDKATDDERAEVLKIFVEDKKNYLEWLNKEIDSNETTKAIKRNIDFATGVALGTIDIEHLDAQGNPEVHTEEDTQGKDDSIIDIQ